MMEGRKEGPVDRYVQAIENVRDAAGKAYESIEAAVRQLEKARAERIAGVPLPQIVEDLVAAGGKATRRKAGSAISEFEHAVMVYRATAIRELVDVHGLNFTQVARLVQVSRQMVSRLYGSVEEIGED